MNSSESIHVPVLRDELLEALDLKQSHTVIDATLGMGGHAQAVLRNLGEDGTLIAFERDPEMVEQLDSSFRDDPRFTLISDSYRRIRSHVESAEVDEVNAVYFDLGLSSYHLDQSTRGFSFKDESRELDCRFNPDLEGDLPGYELVNRATLDELEDVLVEFGEVRNLNQIVRSIDRARPIRTVGDLKRAVTSVVPYDQENGELARVFQAVRIWTNDELEHLRDGLEAALEVLSPGGRLVVISFHSLEDRIVKRFFREEAKECICPPELPVCACDKVKRCRVVTQSPITPGKEEIEANSRARSAKMRVAEKV